MTAPEPRPGGPDGNVRGLIVIVVAVAVGALLLLNANGGGGGGSNDDEASSGGSEQTTSTLIDESDLETTTTAAETDEGRAPSEVTVIVLNGSGQAGAAGSTSETLAEGGYTMATPGNAPTATTTTIYYAEGYETEAIEVAGKLGKGSDSVAPLSSASLGGAEGDANVVVVLGTDTPPVSSTTTEAGGTSASTTSTTSASGN
jgi:hypothetical protein